MKSEKKGKKEGGIWSELSRDMETSRGLYTDKTREKTIISRNAA